MYEAGLGCRQIGKILDESPGLVYKQVAWMGINRDIRQASTTGVSKEVAPFSKPSRSTNVRDSAIGVAIDWFSSRGYVPSIPTSATTYDLIVESDAGLKRVQVKSTTVCRNDRWVVGIHRHVYRPEAEPNACGKFRKTSYTEKEMDLFFVLTSEGDIFLIPQGAVGAKTQLSLDVRYAPFKVT